MRGEAYLLCRSSEECRLPDIGAGAPAAAARTVSLQLQLIAFRPRDSCE
jgi:hypothetical protein